MYKVLLLYYYLGRRGKIVEAKLIKEGVKTNLDLQVRMGWAHIETYLDIGVRKRHHKNAIITNAIIIKAIIENATIKKYSLNI